MMIQYCDKCGQRVPEVDGAPGPSPATILCAKCRPAPAPTIKDSARNIVPPSRSRQTGSITTDVPRPAAANASRSSGGTARVPKRNEASDRKRLWLVAGILALLLIVGGTAIFLFGGKSRGTENAQAAPPPSTPIADPVPPASAPPAPRGGGETIIIDDFDTTETRYLGNRYGTPAGIKSGGPRGNFMRLCNAQPSIFNILAYNRLPDLPTAASLISFDFRVANKTSGAAADGFGFTLAPISTFGATGPFDPRENFSAEVPKVAGALSIGFRIYGSESEIILSFNGTEIRRVESQRLATPYHIYKGENVPDNTSMDRATLTIDWTAKTVTLLITRAGILTTVFDAQYVSGLTHYEGRFVFAARTGGGNANVDLDTIGVAAAVSKAKPQ